MVSLTSLAAELQLEIVEQLEETSAAFTPCVPSPVKPQSSMQSASIADIARPFQESHATKRG